MNNFKNILVDAGTDQSETAVSRAIQWALGNNAQLTLMDVAKPLPKAMGKLADVTCSLLALKPDGFVSPVEISADVLTANDDPLPLI